MEHDASYSPPKWNKGQDAPFETAIQILLKNGKIIPSWLNKNSGDGWFLDPNAHDPFACLDERKIAAWRLAPKLVEVW